MFPFPKVPVRGRCCLELTAGLEDVMISPAAHYDARRVLRQTAASHKSNTSPKGLTILTSVIREHKTTFGRARKRASKEIILGWNVAEMRDRKGRVLGWLPGGILSLMPRFRVHSVGIFLSRAITISAGGRGVAREYRVTGSLSVTDVTGNYLPMKRINPASGRPLSVRIHGPSFRMAGRRGSCRGVPKKVNIMNPELRTSINRFRSGIRFLQL